ncbi:MAG: RNA polymerase sigma factor [Candidatus Eisenbacteria bacterium]
MKPLDPDRRDDRPQSVPEGNSSGGVAAASSPAPSSSAPDREASRRWPRVDATTLEGVRRGDPEALGVFFDLYFDRIYALSHRLLGTRPAAEEVAQEVCYRIQRGAARLDPERDPVPWMLATTVNACRSVWRSARYRMDQASVPIEEVHEQAWDGRRAPTPEDLLAERRRNERVTRAVSELDPSLREVVLLHDYEGLDHKEIAAALGVTHEAARKRYSRALAELARSLKGMDR